MARFIKRPVEVEATQWFKNGDHPLDYERPRNGDPALTEALRRPLDWEGQVVRRYRDPTVHGELPCGYCGLPYGTHGRIDALEGGHIVCPGDWVITGVAGERYPCKPEIFDRTYEPVTSRH